MQMLVICISSFSLQSKGGRQMKGKIPKRSDGSFSDSSNSFVRQVGVYHRMYTSQKREGSNFLTYQFNQVLCGGLAFLWCIS